MKRSTLGILIGGMVLTVIGVCLIQAHWIHHAFKIKHDQLEQQVHLALGRTVDVLEQKENKRFLSLHLKDGGGLPIDSIKDQRILRKVQVVRETVHSEHDLFGENEHVVREQAEVKVEIRRDSNHHGMTIIEQVKDEHGNVAITQQEIAEEIEDRFGWFMKKAVHEFRDLEDPLAHLLDSIDIEEVISKQLIHRGVYQPFEYAILSHDKELDDRWQSSGFKPWMRDGAYRQPLFSNPVLQKEHALLLHLPNEDAYVWHELLSVLLLSGGLILAIVLLFWITMRKLIQQKKLSEIKSDFINNMTHELKTPLATVTLAADSLTHPNVRKDDEQIEHFTNIIKKESARMNRQVEHVMRTSLAEKGKLELQLKHLDAHELVKEMASRAEMQLLEGGTIQLELKATSTTINGDEMHFGNVVSNLIDNAIKYSKDKPDITIKTSNKNNHLHVEVIDRGIGMDKETQGRAFDKFYRATTGNIHDVKGAGIGLSYVKAIVEKHNGTVELKSKPGIGTTVTLRVPAWT